LQGQFSVKMTLVTNFRLDSSRCHMVTRFNPGGTCYIGTRLHRHSNSV